MHATKRTHFAGCLQGWPNCLIGQDMVFPRISGSRNIKQNRRLHMRKRFVFTGGRGPLRGDHGRQRREPTAVAFWSPRSWRWSGRSMHSGCAADRSSGCVPIASERKSRLDTKTPDPTKRKNPRLGLMLMGASSSAGRPGKWDDGWVYDPESGSTYTGKMHLEARIRPAARSSAFHCSPHGKWWIRETGETKNRCVPPAKSDSSRGGG